MSVWSFLSQLLLGPAGRRRPRVSGVLLSGGAYLLLAGVMLTQAQLGLAAGDSALVFSAVVLLGWASFYLLLRSGFSENWTDPKLALQQTGFATLVGVGAHALGGPSHGAQLTLVVMAMVIGMFHLPPVQARWTAGLGVLLLGLVSVWKVWSDPTRHPPAVELLQLVYAGISLVAILSLIEHLSVLRTRLVKQRGELKQAQAQIRMLAIQDELTTLPNRRHMNELIGMERARQQRSGRVMSVAMLDIDHFKRINDSYGHTGGDLVLKTFAQFSRDGLRPTDILARWGGEEFLLLLPETSAEDALLCVARMRAHFARMSSDAIAPGLQVTFSAGISACRASDSLEDAVELADQAMARAKAQGRNCSVLA